MQENSADIQLTYYKYTIYPLLKIHFGGDHTAAK